MPLGDSIFFAGSCFAHNQFQLFRESFYPAFFSPMGMAYHPIAVMQQIERIVKAQPFGEDDLICSGGIYGTYDHHREVGHPNKTEFLHRANESLKDAHSVLSKASTLVMTWGTAFGHFHDQKLVANCHKLPASDFDRRQTDHGEITSRFQEFHELLTTKTNIKNIVLTVSPVRYLRDCFHENTLSKAHLNIAAQALTKLDGVLVFPSYEIMLDELRDYRFFGEDLVHPSNVAKEIIFNRFVEWTFSGDNWQQFFVEARKLGKLMNHSILHESDEAVRFRQKRDEKSIEFKKRWSFAINN